MSNNVTDNNTLFPYSNESFSFRIMWFDKEPVLMAEGVLAFILNSTFLFVLARNKDLVKCKRITYHVANLALADTLVGLSLFMSATIRRDIVHVGIDCLGWFQLINLGAIFVSFMAVLFIAIERIVVIKWHFTWKEILTLKRVFVVIFITWITAVILVIIGFRHIKNILWSHTLQMVILLICGIAILIANSVIACLLQHKTRTLAAIAGAQQTTNSSKKKALKLVIMINIIFMVTCLPYTTVYLIVLICFLPSSNCNFNHLYLLIVYASPFMDMLTNINFFINPIIYIWRDNTYRKAFCNMFKKPMRLNGRLNFN